MVVSLPSASARWREVTASCADALTSREREVVALVAQGLTNREVARVLWISTGTVRKHLDTVYEKLGVRSRAAAAATLFAREV